MTSTPRPIIIVEPEVVESAAKIAAGYDVMPRGPDLTPFFAHKVILWPSATHESRNDFLALARSLTAVASDVKFIIPNGQPDGWNIQKAVANGWTWDQLIEWAKRWIIPIPHISISIEPSPDPVPESIEQVWTQLGISKGGNGQVVHNVDNMLKTISGWPAFKNLVYFDEFHQRYFHDSGKEWSDTDDIQLTIKLQREYGFLRVAVDTVSDAVRVYGKQHARNEPKDWMRTLKWDGTPRIDRFFIDYLGHVDGAYPCAVSRNFWLSMVARVYQPGCQVDNMVILEGRQGVFKSKALQAIGDKWYMEASEEITSKDFFVSLQGKILVEVADLDSFSRADTNRIKKVITCRTDRLRMPYARVSQDFPRRSIFVGSTNESNYLRDNTGARRFWPITVGHIELDRIKSDRDQLFAEAVTRYLNGEDWWVMPVEITLDVQEGRRQFDEWENIIATYLASYGASTLMLSDLAPKVGVDSAHLDLPTQRRLGSILRRMGWQAKVVRDGDFTRRVWALPDQSLLASPSQP